VPDIFQVKTLERRAALLLGKATRCVPYDPDGPSCPIKI